MTSIIHYNVHTLALHSQNACTLLQLVFCIFIQLTWSHVEHWVHSCSSHEGLPKHTQYNGTCGHTHGTQKFLPFEEWNPSYPDHFQAPYKLRHYIHLCHKNTLQCTPFHGLYKWVGTTVQQFFHYVFVPPEHSVMQSGCTARVHCVHLGTTIWNKASRKHLHLDTVVRPTVQI